MMRIFFLLLFSGVMLACSNQPQTAFQSNQTPEQTSKKLNFAQQYLALSSHQQAGNILDSFSKQERLYLSRYSIDYARLRGVYLTQSNQSDEAIKHYQKMLKQYPKDVVLLNNFGVLLLSKKSSELACDLFNRAVIYSSQNSFSGLINLSRCELGSKNVDMASIYLKRAKEINNLPYIGLLTELNLALILGDLSGARQSYNKIQAEQKIAPFTEHRNEYECLLLQYNAVELGSTHYSSSRPPFACVVQGIEYGIWNSRKQ